MLHVFLIFLDYAWCPFRANSYHCACLVPCGYVPLRMYNARPVSLVVRLCDVCAVWLFVWLVASFSGVVGSHGRSFADRGAHLHEHIYIYICMVVPLFALPVAGVCPLSLHILLLVVCRCPRPVAGSCLCSLWVLVCVMCVCRIGWRSCRPCGYYICMSLYMFFCLLVCVNTCLCGPRLLVGMPLRCGCSHACPPTCCLSGVCTQHRCDDTGR